MTMQIDPTDTVAGVPILAVRDVVNKLASFSAWKDGYLAQQLDITLPKARRVVAQLHEKGFVEPVVDPDLGKCYAVTRTGLSFAASLAAKRITRATADRKVAELLERVREVNTQPRFIYRVTELRVFGSYLTDAQRLGDVDLIIWLKRKPGVTDDQWLEHINKSGRRFGNMSLMYSWPKDEVYLFLKNRSRTYSFSSPDNKVAMEATSRVLFTLEDAP